MLFMRTETHSDPCTLPLSERVRLFDATISNRSSPPRPPSRSSSSRRRFRNSNAIFEYNSRYRTQPITVDEVQEASRRQQRLESVSVRSTENVSILRNSFLRGLHQSSTGLHSVTVDIVTRSLYLSVRAQRTLKPLYCFVYINIFSSSSRPGFGTICRCWGVYI